MSESGGILVTGATGGVGREILRLACAAGRPVAGLYHRDHEGAEAARAEWGDAGGLTMLAADLTDDAALDAALATLGADFCPSAIVHLAAPPFDVKPIAKFGWAEYASQMDGILKPLVLLARRYLKPMAKRGGGRVVAALSAVSVGKPPRGFAAYATAKHALLGYMRCLASEYAEKRIAANTVAPGPLDTGMLAALPTLLTDQMREAIPGGEWIDPASVARAVFWLAVEAPPEITGVNIPIASGLTF